jgi:hypothetical protein
MIPCVYAFLPGKDGKHYRYLLDTLKIETINRIEGRRLMPRFVLKSKPLSIHLNMHFLGLKQKVVIFIIVKHSGKK